MKDPYKILGIANTATDDEIKKAYRSLAMKYHPDLNPSTDAHEMFLDIQDAYDQLTDKNYKKPETLFDDIFSKEEPASNNNTNSNKYKRGSKVKTEYVFDPETHVPSYIESYVTIDDFDANCISKVFIWGFLGMIVSIIATLYLVLNAYMLFVPTFSVLSFLLFNIVLYLDVKFSSRFYHAYIVKIIEDAKKHWFSMVISTTDKSIYTMDFETIATKSRYKNNFYTRLLNFDYYKINQFKVTKTLVFEIILQFEGYGKNEYVGKLTFFKNRKAAIIKTSSIFIIVGIILLLYQRLLPSGIAYGYGYFYFLAHFIFIRQLLTSNKTD